ncbi:nuclease SbcCD subunit C [Romboutsia maritimum]|uniref:Nuclease SbcCD subunit C n=1 Tax=Romboutsia maritimum TaxID=2020948 RepID=A0A371ISG9_9FIRM|nr:SbcC/MukB-like Walker B domain-containing protein [Romboutsia maritimum]RDY23405.1 nuclease SbcCD subunit C [Romboutsia maritimum]
MKPIRLELSGLNSYTDKQIIDFDKLTERGLFGIFGNTGSGKSTILDAITIAMYGNIARNTKEYINSSCEKAIITYEFEIGSQNSKRKYKVDRTIVRSKTGTKTSHARLIEIHNDLKETVLADKVGEVNDKVAQVVGLTANDFTRSVVLPQGKFNDFLKLTGSERRDMLERIFNLEKYGRGLIDKVRKRKNVQLQNLRDLNTKLSQYEGIDEELYSETMKDLEKFKVDEKEKNKSLDSAQKLYEESKEIYEEQLKLEKYEIRKKELDLKNNDIKNKTIQLESAINADKVNPYISGVQNLEKKLIEDNTKIDRLEKNLNILNQELLITKNKYEESYKIKNDKLPKLSEEKTKLQSALETEEELISIDEELKEMKEKGTELNIEKEKSEIIKKDFESKKDILLKSVKEIEFNLDKLKISADLKQKIFLAYEYEKEYIKVDEEKKQKEERLKILSKSFDELNLKSKYIEKSKSDIENMLSDAQNHLDLLIEKCPGKSQDILVKSEYIVELKSKVETLKIDEVKKDKLQDELNEIIEKKYNIEREIDTTNEKLVNIKKDILDLDKEIDKLRYLNLASELRNELKENMPCPVCGSRHHENIDITNQDEKIQFNRDKLEKKQKEELEIIHKLEELNIKNSQYVSIEKIKLKELEELKSKIGELNSIQLTNRLDEDQRMLEILKSNVQSWEEDKKITEEKISKVKEEKNSVEKEEVKILETINSYKSTIRELKEDVENLESKYKRIKNEYLGLKTNIKISNLSEKVEEINKNEKTIEELDHEYSKLIKLRDDTDLELKNYQNKLHQIEIELIKTRELYVEKRKSRDEKYNQIIALTKGESPRLLLSNLENEILKISKLEEETKKNLELQREEYDKYLAEKNNVEGIIKTAKEQYKIQQQTLNQLLEENKFENIYAVKRALLESEQMKELGEVISEYEEEQRLITFKIKELKEILGDKRVKKEDFDDLKNNIYNLKVEVGEISKNIGAKQNSLNTVKESLDKLKELNKQHKIVEHKVDLLEDLDKIIQGNRFVEYVATNQLKYIALEASKRLENITKGRYALEIDSTLNFVMRDNFNGGQRRSVDTLSGGETFLTSLSLALALSSQIQLKGSAPLEFFFLDEGFGSLDSELLEIVMESLERLHSDKLSVGIISHVEELKNRVPVKLLVMPSEAGSGSRVKIEYS